MTDCWNSVTIYGPAAEITRFREQCIDLPPGSDPLNAWDGGGWDGYAAEIGYKGLLPGNSKHGPRQSRVVYAKNYREHAPETGSWSFAFDTDGEFPEDLFNELASLFPALNFDCECIDALDEYCGYGWFNVPIGGEPFRQDYEVPEDYWTGGGAIKRDPAAEARHMALTEALSEAAK